jgi:predicted RNA-binding protein (virulence factor B family)
MSEEGKPILQLFGYHLSQKTANGQFTEMGRAAKQIFVSLDDLKKLCQSVWPEMGKYELVLPLIFRILKRGDCISLVRFDRFVEVLMMDDADLPQGNQPVHG